MFRRFKHTLSVAGTAFKTDEWTNAPKQILDHVGRDLYKQPAHPIGILRQRIESRLAPLQFTPFSDFSPVVSVYDNFDALGFPQNHPGRSRSDTYYLNKETLLRTHSSAHEIACFKQSPTPGYLITADVYRRDTVDKVHYPVFHQMEGARTWKTDKIDESELIKQLEHDLALIPRPTNLEVEDTPEPVDKVEQLVAANLKRTLELVIADLFSANSVIKARWVNASFPWTAPSYEIEVWWQGRWLEICGCGLVRQEVYANAGIPNSVGWAFGIGLERAAMLLFKIPDIRLFWSQNPKFADQFKQNQITEFKPWSKFPSSCKDVAFWNDSNLHVNDVMEIIRTSSDIVENVELIDTFQKDKRTSVCYRITYQCMDRTLTSPEISAVQNNIIAKLAASGAVIR